ncbi:MAG TPA: NAD-dependent epimerase/dehydratase family protein [Ktedonobacteraceae bacterium]|jgi:nucleoside-diphosphate-sugar epimerase
MRCFVTGAAGFVGSHLAERLLADGHEVCGIDSFTDDYDRWLKERNLEGSRSWNRFQFIEGDLVDVTLQPLLEGVDWIFHQAGQETGQTNWASAFTHYTESNVLTTLRLLEVALRFGWIRRFVYASSSSVYGQAARLPVHEDELERPRSPHGVTKLAAESLCSLYNRRFGLPTVSLRYFNVYGPRQRPDMAFHRFCKAIVCHEPLCLHGDGYQTRDFIYIDDVIEANIRAAASEVVGQVINIASGTSVTLRSIVELLEEISGSHIKVAIDDSQNDDVRHICANTQRAQQLLDYYPRMDLRDGLAYEFEFIRRLYEHRPNLAARRVVHQDCSDDGPMSSEDYIVTKKDTLINLTTELEPQTKQMYNRFAEPTPDMLQPIEEAPEDYSTVSKVTAKLRVAMKPETGPADSQTPQPSHMVEQVADTAQPTAATNDYATASKATAPNLTAMPLPDTKQPDSYIAELVIDTVPPIEAANDYATANKATAPNLTAMPLPETKQADGQTVSQRHHTDQADSSVTEPIADAAQPIETQMDTLADAQQEQHLPYSGVNDPADKQDEHIPILPTPSTVIPTNPWIPPNRLTRPAPRYTEQNHMGVAIITLLLVGLLMLGGCLAIYTQFIGSPSAVVTQQGTASSAMITITTDASKTLENTFPLTAVTGNPDVRQHQIKARQVSATTQPVSKSVQVANASTSTDGSTDDTSQPTNNGQNTTNSSVVQQSDIDAAANDLEAANTPSAANVLQPQLAPNEQLVGNPQCQPQVSADHKAGDIADSVTVTVVFSCSGEAYDQDAAAKMAAQELAEQAKRDLGSLYALSGQITTTVKDASISDASQGTITVPVEAHGTWVLQLHRNQQQAWANSLAGKNKQAAQSFLLRQNGVKQANIHLQGGDGHTLPTDAKKIIIKVQPIAGS